MEIERHFEKARAMMVHDQIERRGICDNRLLKVLGRVPRHRFVPQSMAEYAYSDGPLAIGQGQTISQPYIVAVMTDLLKLTGSETVLEIGTGSGYQAAVLAEMAQSVHSIERYADLALRAANLLQTLGYPNVSVHVADGSLGWLPAAPYQAMLVTAAAPYIPQPLLDQLDEGGRLVIPVGNRHGQDLQLCRKVNGQIAYESIFPVAFVPLRGQYGWKINEWEERTSDTK